jgi:hypothetical protein
MSLTRRASGDSNASTWTDGRRRCIDVPKGGEYPPEPMRYWYGVAGLRKRGEAKHAPDLLHGYMKVILLGKSPSTLLFSDMVIPYQFVNLGYKHIYPKSPNSI